MMRQRTVVYNLFALSALLLAASLVAGCALGRKQWPEPVLAEDSFSIVSVEGFREGDCLTVILVLQGNLNNLHGAQLQLQPTDGEGGCDSCPFTPLDGREYRPGDPGFTVQMDTVRLEYCELKPDRMYRWRVMLTNQHPTLPPLLTDVYRPRDS